MVSFDQQNKDGWTALMIAIDQEQEKIALALIEKMDGFTHQNKDGSTALILACAKKMHHAALALVEKMDTLNQMHKDGFDALSVACSCNLEQIALRIITKLGGCDQIAANELSILMTACLFENRTIIQRIIDTGCNINLANSDGVTALHLASAAGKLEATKLLLDQKDIILELTCTIDGKTFTALELAEEEGHNDVATLIKKAIQNSQK